MTNPTNIFLRNHSGLLFLLPLLLVLSCSEKKRWGKPKKNLIYKLKKILKSSFWAIP
jgi:hypothetical protein